MNQLLYLEKRMQDSTHRKSSHRKSFPGVILFALIILGGSHAARAQALPGASKIADVSVFAGYTHSNPDYGPTDNNGVTVGADYTRHFGWQRLAPAFEVRAGYNTGDLITQKTILAGVRLMTDVHRFHPYADALFGGNQLDFKFIPNPRQPSYTSDSSFTTSYGGGVDIDVYRNFQAKVDFQAQSSNYGYNGLTPLGKDFTLSPTFLTIGVVYRLGGRPR
jgi:hypothetical protein